jgi:hypothetical protein
MILSREVEKSIGRRPKQTQQADPAKPAKRSFGEYMLGASPRQSLFFNPFCLEWAGPLFSGAQQGWRAVAIGANTRAKPSVFT